MTEIVQITIAPSRELYEAASAELVGVIPAGLIVHTATESADGSVRIVDVWESRDAAESFGKDVLGPIIERQMAAAGMQADDSMSPKRASSGRGSFRTSRKVKLVVTGGVPDFDPPMVAIGYRSRPRRGQSRGVISGRTRGWTLR
jgi:hypothetical protein